MEIKGQTKEDGGQITDDVGWISLGLGFSLEKMLQRGGEKLESGSQILDARYWILDDFSVKRIGI